MTLKDVNACYEPNDHFKGDETCLNPYNPPDRGMATHKISGKKNKFQITIFFVCNAMGTEKLPPFFIKTYANPHFFQKKSGKELGFYYQTIRKPG